MSILSYKPTVHLNWNHYVQLYGKIEIGIKIQHNKT